VPDASSLDTIRPTRNDPDPRVPRRRLRPRLERQGFAIGAGAGRGRHTISEPAAESRPVEGPLDRGGKPEARIGVPGGAGGLAFAFGSVWLGGAMELLRVDPASDTIVATIPLDSKARTVFASKTLVCAGSPPSVSCLDPSTNKMTGTLPAGRLFAYGSAWDTDPSGTLIRIDPATGRTLASVRVEGRVDWQPQLAVGFGSLWVGSGDEHRVIRVDPKTTKVVATIEGISDAYSLLPVGVGFGSVWAQSNAASGSGILYRIDPATNKIVASMQLGVPAHGGQYGGTDIAFDDTSVWTGDTSPTVTRVDPATNQVVATLGVGRSPEWMVVGAGSIWVDSGNNASVVRFAARDWVRS
jgi:hypothetical protein